MALNWRQNFVSAQYLENALTESDQILYAHQHWHDLAWDCYLLLFAKFWRSYVLDWHQNFVSAQYLENKLTESDQILYAHQHWQDLAWDCCPSFFAKFWRSYGPWLKSEFRFRSISWEQIDRIGPNFVCTSSLTRSSLGLLPVIFRKILTVLRPLIDVRISFPLNILRTHWQNPTKFCMHINIDKI